MTADSAARAAAHAARAAEAAKRAAEASDAALRIVTAGRDLELARSEAQHAEEEATAAAQEAEMAEQMYAKAQAARVQIPDQVSVSHSPRTLLAARLLLSHSASGPPWIVVMQYGRSGSGADDAWFG